MLSIASGESREVGEHDFQAASVLFLQVVALLVGQAVDVRPVHKDGAGGSWTLSGGTPSEVGDNRIVVSIQVAFSTGLSCDAAAGPRPSAHDVIYLHFSTTEIADVRDPVGVRHWEPGVGDPETEPEYCCHKSRPSGILGAEPVAPVARVEVWPRFLIFG